MTGVHTADDPIRAAEARAEAVAVEEPPRTLRRGMIFASGSCLLSDVKTFFGMLDEHDLPQPDVVIGVNQAPLHYTGHMDHWVTLHSDQFDGWRKQRQRIGGNVDCVYWSRPRVDQPAIVTREAEHWKGSSGLLAISAATQPESRTIHVDDRDVIVGGLDLDVVALCGMPMDNRPHVGRGSPWNAALKFREEWAAHLNKFRDRVRSMSPDSWTQLVLGPVTPGFWMGEPDLDAEFEAAAVAAGKMTERVPIPDCPAVRHGGRVRCIRKLHGTTVPHSDKYGRQWWDKGRFGPTPEPVDAVIP